MKQCLKCFSYDQEKDDMIRGLDDCIIEGEDHSDWHYCGEYNGSPKTDNPKENGYTNRIPDDVINDKGNCPFFLDIEKMCDKQFIKKGKPIPDIFQDKIAKLVEARNRK